MDWKKLVILSISIGLLQSCFLKAYTTTEYGSDRPKHNRFKIGKYPYNLKFDDPIKTDFVYTKIDSAYFKSAITKENVLFVNNVFLRFFSNGRYLKSSTKKNYNSALEDYNNLKNGIVGYYEIKDNKLFLEYFLTNAHNNGKYYMLELNLIKDSIEGYKKLKIEGLTGTPDW
ncbi:hypothetical protein [Flavobacterium sp. H122]|uniref:hypothetical protein n=1 Tax=Flavobacterium sp. H122 TaxID=2529860 RepID=UPI0010AAB427|nr:hypothetical protein [Flavobacterium sp. H122]